MESILIKIAELIWNKTDPLLVVCIMLLGYWQYKTSRRLGIHLDPKTKYPHPECEWGEKSYKFLCKNLETQHKENREDHEKIYNLLRKK